MARDDSNPVVHLELHTRDLAGACGFYAALFGWRAERIEVPSGTYQALAPGAGLDGGVVECGAERAVWLPYVEVADVVAATGRAQALGASVLLEPREGPAGSRSVISARAGAEVGLWQPKRNR